MVKRHRALSAFGLNVRRRREARELTQEDPAEKADLDPTYISGIERRLVQAALKRQWRAN